MKKRKLKTFLVGSGLVSHDSRTKRLLEKGIIRVNDEIQKAEDYDKQLQINDIVNVGNCLYATVKD